MNIFFLDYDPLKAAQELCDIHIQKMATETAQILSNAMRLSDGYKHKGKAPSGRIISIYTLNGKDTDGILINERVLKPVKPSHPCSLWAIESHQNYIWLAWYYNELCCEHVRRFKKPAKISLRLPSFWFVNNVPKNLPQTDGITFPALAMPQEYRTEDAVESYREYYRSTKVHFARWDYQATPEWFLID